MARGEGRPEGGLAGLVAGLTDSLGRSGTSGGRQGAGSGKHRPLEEAFVREGGVGGAGTLKLKGFVEEDFGVVFDEVMGKGFEPTGVLVLKTGQLKEGEEANVITLFHSVHVFFIGKWFVGCKRFMELYLEFEFPILLAMLSVLFVSTTLLSKYRTGGMLLSL